VDEPYDKFEVNGNVYSMVQGDYTPQQFGDLVLSYIQEASGGAPTNPSTSSCTISNFVYTFTYPGPFVIGKKTTCNTALGLPSKVSINATEITEDPPAYYLTMPNQYSFDIPDSFYIYIDDLNNNLNTKTNQRYFWQILNTSPQEGQLSYENNTSSVVMVPPNNAIDYLPVQIKDVNGNFIDFHGVEWTLVIEVAEYLNYVDSTPSVGLTADPLLTSQPSLRKRRYY
jgi:hypothetical protein